MCVSTIIDNWLYKYWYYKSMQFRYLFCQKQHHNIGVFISFEIGVREIHFYCCMFNKTTIPCKVLNKQKQVVRRWFICRLLNPSTLDLSRTFNLPEKRDADICEKCRTVLKWYNSCDNKNVYTCLYMVY